MNNKIKINYSICNYVPSDVRQESVIFGIVIHCPSEEYAEFKRTKNLRRLRAFDDEYDPEYIKLMTETFKYYFNYPNVETEEYDEDRFNNILNDNFISDITRFYVNEFRFSEVRSILSTKNEVVNDIQDLIKTYLYYDRPKAERISKDEVKRLLKKEFNNLELQKHIEPAEIFDLADRSVYDFKYEDTIIKAMSFDYKRKTDIVDQIKSFHSDLMCNEEYFKSKKIKIIIDNKINNKEDFYSEVIDRLHKMNDNIEILPISDYTNSLIFKGLY